MVLNIIPIESSCKVLIVVNSLLKSYNCFVMHIKPYLENFGIPYDILDIGIVKPEMIDAENCSLIILSHNNILAYDSVNKIILPVLVSAVSSGVGLINFDSDLFDFSSCLIDSSSSGEAASQTDIFLVSDNNHYITAGHEEKEKIPLLRSIEVLQKGRLNNSKCLVAAGNVMLLETGELGKGRIVNWNNLNWMSHEIKGPVFGMDDLVWKGIVWASRKPFVMQGMPPFITMRVDDVWGSARSGHEDSLYWIGVCNKYGLKPWCGIFQDNMTNAALRSLKHFIDCGGATAFPHAFAGKSSSTGGIPENFIYFDHLNERDYSDEVMQRNALKAESFFKDNGLPISKVALPHYYEYGFNALKYFAEWGCEFIGTHMLPGQSYKAEDGQWLMCGPYRLHENGFRSSGIPRPVYYADYLDISDDSQMKGKLFNCVVEIRDNAGYEWCPDNNIESTIKRAITQLKRSFESMVLAALFTHESDYIQYISPSNWEIIISKIFNEISNYNPVYVSTDFAYQYIKAKHNIKLTNVKTNGQALIIGLTGYNDIPTKCYVFTESIQGQIHHRLVDIPQVFGSCDINIMVEA